MLDRKVVGVFRWRINVRSRPRAGDHIAQCWRLSGDGIARQAENEAAMPLKPHPRPQYLPLFPALFGIAGEGSIFGPGPQNAPRDPKVGGRARKGGLALRAN
jgi:hypothetical protein